jgi:pyruvate dehydrogenase E2 component (dihydrolipoamide acetyltransferase)
MSGKIFPVSMPKWGMTMEEGKVTDWLISEGEVISEGDEIVEIETDKISNVVESQTSGILVRHLVVEGSTYKVGSLIGVIIDGDVEEDEIDNFIRKFQSEEKIKTDTEETTNKTQKIQVGNLELNFLEVFCEKPEEETIVFVHGFGGDLNSWSYNQVELSTHFNTISLDLPGHGGSALEVGSGNVSELSEILISFFEKKEINQAHLVGHSLGGAISLLMAYRMPEIFKTLTLICPVLPGCETNTEFLEGFIYADSRKQMRNVVSELYANPKVVNRNFIDETLKSRRFDGAKQALSKIKEANFLPSGEVSFQLPSFEAIKAPIQIIQGSEDKIIKFTGDDLLSSNIKIHELNASGHMPQMEEHNQVNKIIEAFINSARGSI